MNNKFAIMLYIYIYSIYNIYASSTSSLRGILRALRTNTLTHIQDIASCGYIIIIIALATRYTNLL